MTRRRTTLLIAASFMAVGLLATSCSSAGGSTGGEKSGGSATGAQGFQEQHKGGTLTLLAAGAAGTLDPQINYMTEYWEVYQGVYDGLLAFKKVGGQGSYDIVPDLATAMPEITNDGKTYTFTLRKGIKFSTGADVTLDDVVASFQRIFKVSGPTAGTFYNDIVGADACLKTPATCTLDGGVVADQAKGTITINLKAADSELKYKLALPHATILPKDSPPKDAGTTPLPTTGPYMFASYDPNQLLKMVRNPYFTQWSAEAQPQGYPDEIDFKFGLTVEAQVTAIQNGQADWMFDPPPADRLSELGTKYAKQVHVNPMAAMYFLTLNVNEPPFNNEKVRQAISWAVDRDALVQLYGGSNMASPVCTILPPGFPGHVDSCQYTKGGGDTWKAPDLAKAKQLVADSGTAGQEVGIIVEDNTVNRSMGEYMQSLLDQLGYKAKVEPLSTNISFTYMQNTKNHVQMGLLVWYADYPAASDFLHVLLSCESFHPGSDSSVNTSGFCDKQIDAKMKTAAGAIVANPDSGNAQWAAIDKEILSHAPVVPFLTPKRVDFASARVGNYQYSRQYFMIINQLWVK